MAAKIQWLQLAVRAVPRGVPLRRITLSLEPRQLRFLATAKSPKPRPYEKPLVSSRTQSPQNDRPVPAVPPIGQKKEYKGVYAPKWRLSIGVVLIGSIVYSMVTTGHFPGIGPV